MAEHLVQLVESGYRAWNSGDRTWVLNHMTEDVEWITSPDDPDSRTYFGQQAVQTFWDEWRAAVGQLQFELIEVLAREDEVLVHAARKGRGAHSGLEVSDEVIQIFSFDAEDRCHRVREFYDREQANRVLSESGGSEWRRIT